MMMDQILKFFRFTKDFKPEDLKNALKGATIFFSEFTGHTILIENESKKQILEKHLCDRDNITIC